jgi:hypothetical protein
MRSSSARSALLRRLRRAELARDGADLGRRGFPGVLTTKAPAVVGKVKANLSVPALTIRWYPDQVVVRREMRAASVRDWQVISYGNTLHGFTNPAADGSILPAALYNQRSDRRSWAKLL